MFTLAHLDTPPPESMESQLLQMVVDYLSDVSPVSLGPSNPLYQLYQYVVGFEVHRYLDSMDGAQNGKPELIMALDAEDPAEDIGGGPEPELEEGVAGGGPAVSYGAEVVLDLGAPTPGASRAVAAGAQAGPQGCGASDEDALAAKIEAMLDAEDEDLEVAGSEEAGLEAAGGAPSVSYGKTLVLG